MAGLTLAFSGSSKPGSTLLLPGALMPPDWLTASEREQLRALPGLRRLDREAEVESEYAADGPAPIEPGHEHWLRQRFGIDAQESVAAAAVQAEGEAQAQWRLEPVYFRLARDHLVLTDPIGLALAPEEALQLAAAVLPVFEAEGLRLRASGVSRWSLSASGTQAALALTTPSLAGAIGRNIEVWLPSGPDARRWRKLLNEVQMTWYEHPVNTQRADSGRPPVNGLWIEGRVPATADRSLAACALQLAREPSRSSEARPIPLEANDSLHIDTALLDAVYAGDARGWIQAWNGLNARWLDASSTRVDTLRPLRHIVFAGDSGWRSTRLRQTARWWPLPSLRRTDWLALPGQSGVHPPQTR